MLSIFRRVDVGKQYDIEKVQSDKSNNYNGTHQDEIGDTKNKEKLSPSLRTKETVITATTETSFITIDKTLWKIRFQACMRSKVVTYLCFGSWISICILGNIVTAVLLYQNNYIVDEIQNDTNVTNNISLHLEESENQTLDIKSKGNQSEAELRVVIETENDIRNQNVSISNSTYNEVSNYSKQLQFVTLLSISKVINSTILILRIPTIK